MPEEMTLAQVTVINGMAYIGGGSNDQSIVKYDPVKNEWSTLPPPPVMMFGVGQLNGKLVIVGGEYKKEEEEEEEEEEEVEEEEVEEEEVEEEEVEEEEEEEEEVEEEEEEEEVEEEEEEEEEVEEEEVEEEEVEEEEVEEKEVEEEEEEEEEVEEEEVEEEEEEEEEVEEEEEEQGQRVTGDIYVFEEETQQWVKSISPMPSRLGLAAVVCHGSCLVVCGGTSPDDSPSASVSVYNSQSSQWHSAQPLPFSATLCSAVVVNDTCYVAAGCDGEVGTADKIIQSSSQSVAYAPLSTLLDPNASQQASTWQRMPDTPFCMSSLVATGGCLLAVGGYSKPPENDDVEQNVTTIHAYCSSTSSWVNIGDMPDQKIWATITTLPSGELFVGGGVCNDDDRKKVFIGIIN